MPGLTPPGLVPASLMPTALGGPAGGTGAGTVPAPPYFGADYWAGGHFAPDYWPGATAADAGDLPASLLEALRALLEADAGIAAVAGGRVWYGRAGRGAAWPFVVWFQVAEPQSDAMDGDDYDAETTFQVSAFAETIAGADALRRAIRRALRPPGMPPGYRDPLRWATGVEFDSRFTAGPLVPDGEPVARGDGRMVQRWQAVGTFVVLNTEEG